MEVRRYFSLFRSLYDLISPASSLRISRVWPTTMKGSLKFRRRLRSWVRVMPLPIMSNLSVSRAGMMPS
ncbi:hypothetical protein D3C80_1603990 [compost metagenome]